MIYMINMNTTLMYKEKKKYNINWWTKKLFSAFIFHFWWKGTNELMNISVWFPLIFPLQIEVNKKN